MICRSISDDQDGISCVTLGAKNTQLGPQRSVNLTSIYLVYLFRDCGKKKQHSVMSQYFGSSLCHLVMWAGRFWL